MWVYTQARPNSDRIRSCGVKINVMTLFTYYIANGIDLDEGKVTRYIEQQQIHVKL